MFLLSRWLLESEAFGKIIFINFNIVLMFNSFMTGPYHIKTNQLSGFYIKVASVMIELRFSLFFL